jgi:hypothetical protein
VSDWAAVLAVSAQGAVVFATGIITHAVAGVGTGVHTRVVYVVIVSVGHSSVPIDVLVDAAAVSAIGALVVVVVVVMVVVVVVGEVVVVVVRK